MKKLWIYSLTLFLAVLGTLFFTYDSAHVPEISAVEDGATQAHTVPNEDELYIGYHKMHNDAYNVDVYVKDGIDISEEFLMHFLTGLDSSERSALRIEEITMNDKIACGEMGQRQIVKPARSDYYYSKHVVNDACCK